MEQHKLETQFKEKLNSREIKPTDMAWDRLEAMLSVVEEKKPIRRLNWIYVAASFIGFLLISTVFFNQKETPNDVKKNNVVIINAKPKENSKSEIKSLETKPNLPETILKSETILLVQTHKSIKTKDENPILMTPQNVVAKIQIHNSNETIDGNKYSIPENIDSLLASVERNPKTGVENSYVKINSTDLLNQVDEELQVSFREKALNTITQKYREAKEALANRNSN